MPPFVAVLTSETPCGNLLVLGPQGDMGTHYADDICRAAAWHLTYRYRLPQAVPCLCACVLPGSSNDVFRSELLYVRHALVFLTAKMIRVQRKRLQCEMQTFATVPANVCRSGCKRYPPPPFNNCYTNYPHAEQARRATAWG